MAVSCRERRAGQASRSHRNQPGKDSNGLITAVPMVAVPGLLVAISVALHRACMAGNAAAIVHNAYFNAPKYLN